MVMFLHLQPTASPCRILGLGDRFLGGTILRCTALWCVALGWTVSAGLLSAMSAHGQVLVDTLSAAAAQQNLQAGNAGNAAAAAGQPANEPAAAGPAPRSDEVGFGGTKYLPAYVLVLMLIALGAFVICRPGNRHDPT